MFYGFVVFFSLRETAIIVAQPKKFCNR